jgi:hypothetical protein
MNSNWALVFAAISPLFPIAPIAAQEEAVLGQGNVPCGAWLSERRDDQLQGANRIAWVLGYVTAFNKYESEPAGDVSGGMSTEEIKVWIDGHCSQYPNDNLYRASDAFVDEFRRKLGR